MPKLIDHSVYTKVPNMEHTKDFKDNLQTAPNPDGIRKVQEGIEKILSIKKKKIP